MILLCDCLQGMFDSLRYDERQTDYQQKLLDVSKVAVVALCL